MKITGNVVDIAQRRIFPAEITVSDGRIHSLTPVTSACSTFLLPGFIDAHVHVESSMLAPSAFAAAAVIHGTVATVSDPHEIANVLGADGVAFMLREAVGVPFKFAFGAPACVPATTFETAGAALDEIATRELLQHAQISYLSEMMDWPGVLQRLPGVMAKINAARALGKRVDGHAPGLRGADAAHYHAAGIETDHECFTLAEAHDKLAAGALILIREGSAARNFEALWPLIDSHPGRVMLCSDDKHPNDLLRGHINELCARLVAKGADLFHTLRAACVLPVEHYRLPVGLLRPGDPADFIEVSDLQHFHVHRTWIDGHLVAQHGVSCFPPRRPTPVNRFHCHPIPPHQFRIPLQPGRLRVIAAHDGQLVTRCELWPPKIHVNGSAPEAVADPARDLLKITVVNRYAPSAPAVAFVRGFGLQRGAIAGSVAHDSHNVIAVGASDYDLSRAVNAVIVHSGGLAVAHGAHLNILPLPIAGLMSPDDCPTVAAAYECLDAAAKSLGSTLRAPFMTLSFMALLVIPALKLSDRGLFDCEQFNFTSLFDHTDLS